MENFYRFMFGKAHSIYDYMSWETYDSLPKIDVIDIPFLANFQFHLTKESAWHIGSKGVFPHTRRYRMLRAICQNDINEINDVLNEGLDVNQFLESQYGHTPITLASELNRPAIIEYLQFRGGDIDKQDLFGKTALDHAVVNWNFDSIKSLVNLGCDIQAQDQFGFTAVDQAQLQNYFSIHNFLVKEIQEQKKRVQSARGQKPIRDLQKFQIKLDFENYLRDECDDLIKNKSFFSNQPLLYPFNDTKGKYKIQLSVQQ